MGCAAWILALAQAKAAPQAPHDFAWCLAASPEEASAKAVESNRPILYAAYGVDGCGNQEIDWASVSSALQEFVRGNLVVLAEALNPENEIQKKIGIKSSGLAGLDKHLNFTGLRYPGIPAEDKVVGFALQILQTVRAFESQLRASAAKAAALEARGDEAGAIQEYKRSLDTPKSGYPEFETARARLEALAESDAKKVLLLLARPETEKSGLALAQDMEKKFRGLPQAMEGQLAAAQVFAQRNQIQASIERIQRVLRSDAKPQTVKAQELLGRIVAEGIRQIRVALASGVEVGVQSAREKIAKIQKDYAGTEVAKHAADVLADLR